MVGSFHIYGILSIQCNGIEIILPLKYFTVDRWLDIYFSSFREDLRWTHMASMETRSQMGLGNFILWKGDCWETFHQLKNSWHEWQWIKIITKFTESKKRQTSCWRNNWNLKKSTAKYCKYITYLHLHNHYLYNI